MTVDTTAELGGWYQQTLAAEVRTAVKVIQLAAVSLSPEEREQQTSAFTRHTLQRGVDRIRPFSLPADPYTWAAPTRSAMVKARRRVVTHVGIIYRVVLAEWTNRPLGIPSVNLGTASKRNGKY